MLKTIVGWAFRLTWLVWLVLLVLIGASFANQNPGLVQITIFQWVLPQVSTGLIVSITLFFGVAVGVCVFLPSLLLAKARVKRLRAKLQKTQDLNLKLSGGASLK